MQEVMCKSLSRGSRNLTQKIYALQSIICLYVHYETQQRRHGTNLMTQEEYVREGIEWEHVEFFDNAAICDLVERNNCGLISLLDEAAMRKQPLAGFFMSQSTDGEQSPAALSAGFLDRAGHVHEQGGAVAFKLHNS